MTKIIYLLDPATGAFMGESLHPLDPVETERAGEPVYALLNPLLAVEDAPPNAPAGVRAVRVDGAWTLQALPELPESEAPIEPPESPEPVPPSVEQRIAAKKSRVQERLDAMARARDWDDIKSAALRAGYAGPYQAEGITYALWMDTTWHKFWELMGQWTRGEIEEPMEEELLAQLPPLEGLPDPAPPVLPVSEEPIETPE